jgi:hypothetical protein
MRLGMLSGQRRRDEGVRAGSAEPPSRRVNGEEESGRERKRESELTSVKHSEALRSEFGNGGGAPGGARLRRRIVARSWRRGRENWASGKKKLHVGRLFYWSFAQPVRFGKKHIASRRVGPTGGGGGSAPRADVHAGRVRAGRHGWAAMGAGHGRGRPRWAELARGAGLGAGARALGSWAAALARWAAAAGRLGRDARGPTREGGGSVGPSGGEDGGRGGGWAGRNGPGERRWADFYFFFSFSFLFISV